MEKSLVIIKPNCIKKKCIGEIIDRFEKNKFKITGLKMEKLTRDEMENFYYLHRGKPFFNNLVKFMISDYCVFMVIEGEGVIKKIRKFIGETDPEKAEKHTIRAIYADSDVENAIHASDRIDSAKFEVNFFFPELSS